MDRGPVGRATFEPGWQWSKHVKPIAGTDSCQSAHMGYFISGRMKIVARKWSFDRVISWNALRATTPGSMAMNPVSSSTGRASPTTPSAERSIWLGQLVRARRWR